MKHIVFDFDSTIVKNEGLNDVCKIALDGDQEKIKQVDEIVNKAMNGLITPLESMNFRLQIAKISSDMITKVVNDTQITEGMENLLTELKNDKENNVIIVSGGFHEMIEPIANKLGITKIYANKFIMKDGFVVGVEDSILLQKQGKVKLINSLNLQGKKIMIGDGYTDLETYKFGAVDSFIAFCGVVSRELVIKESKNVANNVEELGKIIRDLF